ncbi:MAG: exodeoxyribonuclease VII small subunit [Calditrichia bacterium]
MTAKMSFEQAMKRLEEIANLLESGELSLDDSIKIYEEGTKLIEFCESKLNEAAKKVQKLTRVGESNFQLSDLDTAETE